MVLKRQTLRSYFEISSEFSELTGHKPAAKLYILGWNGNIQEIYVALDK